MFNLILIKFDSVHACWKNLDYAKISISQIGARNRDFIVISTVNRPCILILKQGLSMQLICMRDY